MRSVIRASRREQLDRHIFNSPLTGTDIDAGLIDAPGSGGERARRGCAMDGAPHDGALGAAAGQDRPQRPSVQPARYRETWLPR